MTHKNYYLQFNVVIKEYINRRIQMVNSAKLKSIPHIKNLPGMVIYKNIPHFGIIRLKKSTISSKITNFQMIITSHIKNLALIQFNM